MENKEVDKKENKAMGILGGIVLVIFFLVQLVIGLCLMVGFYLFLAFVAKLGWNAMFGAM